MRIFPAILIALAAWAQTPNPIVSPLRQANQVITDYGNRARYAADDEKAPPPAAGEQRVVFMGDSITDGWGRTVKVPFFPGKPYINRGISGQTTAQMLLRFYPDVIELHPRAVLILAGTNDIGGNLGPESLEYIESNLAAMTDLAHANGIKVILATLTPVCDYHRPQTQQRPPEKINELNRWIKDYTVRHRDVVYLDYFSATVDDKGFFRAEITEDGLHPNAQGYEIMAPLAQKAIDQALGQ
jgi:lysophospholipase L1-like esterase